MQPPQPQNRAKSRLQTERTNSPAHDSVSTPIEQPRSPAALIHKKKPVSTAPLIKVLTKRIKFIPLLILGVLFYSILFHIITSIDPENIANIFFYESYIPIHIIFLLSNFFLLNFIFLHTRRALLWSIFLSILLLFKLQAIVFTIPTIAVTVLIFSFLEGFFTFIFKK